jgi:tyrosine-protein kinase Etk/Wzc
MRLPEFMRARQAKQIAATTVVGAVLALGYALSAPKWYQSTLTVVPAAPAKGGGLGSQIAGALGNIDIPELSVNADVERISAVFESISVTDAVIRKFDLVNRYQQSYIEHTRATLRSHCTSRIDRKARMVSLSCEDQDPRFVKQMLEYFGELGNEVFRRISTSSASEEVRFLDQRVAEMRKEADDAARKLRDFEERYKVIDLDSQSKAVVSAMASLRSQEISKELQLSYMNSYSSREESTAVQLRQQLTVMNAKFRKLEQAPPDGPFVDTEPSAVESKSAVVKNADIFPPAMTVPRLRFELEQLYRERKIRETDLILLMQRLEMAKVNEARDTSAFQILDHPALPTYKSRPRRAVVVATGLILGFLAGIAWVFGPRLLRSESLAGPPS